MDDFYDDELDGPKFFTRFRARLAPKESKSSWCGPPEITPEQREANIAFLASRADSCLNLFDTTDEKVYSHGERTFDDLGHPLDGCNTTHQYGEEHEEA